MDYFKDIEDKSEKKEAKKQDEKPDEIVEAVLEKIRKQKRKRNCIAISSVVLVMAFVLVKLVTAGVIHISWYENYQDRKAKKRDVAIAEAKDIYDLLPYTNNGNQKSKESLYEDYANNFIRINDKVGYIDDQLNVKIPLVYDEIEGARVNNLGAEQEENYYKVKGSDGIGLLDCEMNFLFEPKYLMIEVFADGKYLIGERDDATGENILKIVNNNKEIICESNIGGGYCEGCYLFGGEYVLKIRCREGRRTYAGILNGNLEPIIPVKYDDVKLSVYHYKENYEFYRVIKNNQCASFDISGEQLDLFVDIEE